MVSSRSKGIAISVTGCDGTGNDILNGAGCVNEVLLDLSIVKN